MSMTWSSGPIAWTRIGSTFPAQSYANAQSARVVTHPAASRLAITTMKTAFAKMSDVIFMHLNLYFFKFATLVVLWEASGRPLLPLLASQQSFAMLALAMLVLQ